MRLCRFDVRKSCAFPSPFRAAGGRCAQTFGLFGQIFFVTKAVELTVPAIGLDWFQVFYNTANLKKLFYSILRGKCCSRTFA